MKNCDRYGCFQCRNTCTPHMKFCYGLHEHFYSQHFSTGQNSIKAQDTMIRHILSCHSIQEQQQKYMFLWEFAYVSLCPCFTTIMRQMCCSCFFGKSSKCCLFWCKIKTKVARWPHVFFHSKFLTYHFCFILKKQGKSFGGNIFKFSLFSTKMAIFCHF